VKICELWGYLPKLANIQQMQLSSYPLMKTIAALCLSAYFLAGTMLLPAGDFSTLPDLPKMYVDCKTIEDPDMDLPDFITEHLLMVDIGSLFENGVPEPNEKPHQPIQFHHQIVQISLVAQVENVECKPVQVVIPPASIQTDEIYIASYAASVFRPPISS
jgi:hypothetical protein